MSRLNLVKLSVTAWCLLIFNVACTSSNLEEAADPSKQKLRLSAVHDAALTYGAQSGLAWQAGNIKMVFDSNAQSLDSIFNFNALLMKNSLLPPVLSDSKDTLHLNENTIRLSDRVIEIIQPARFVSTPPSWRDYLKLNYEAPKAPDPSLLPKNAYERYIWDQVIPQGWQQGIQQANTILITLLGEMQRDFSGMALYHALYAQNMVSAPQTARAHLGITGNKRRIRVNDQLLRITAHSDLNYDRPQEWNPALTHEPVHQKSKRKTDYYGRK